MCGIVGYIGTKEKKIGELLKNALFNVYRGNNGVGIIYLDSKDGKIHIDKYLYKLQEMYNSELEEERATKTTSIGSVEFVEKDEGRYEQLQNKFKKEMSKLLDTRSSFVFLHHRKATYGGNEIKNLHPLEFKDKYYIHNGTASVDSVKAYLQLHTKIEFTSETDTEVLAMLYNHLKDLFKNNMDKVYEHLKRMFPNGWGVLIEICRDGTVTLIKDYSRGLWGYKMNDDGYVYISEPTPYIRYYSKLHFLNEGIYELGKDIDGEDFTTMSKKVLKWWVEALKTENLVDYEHKCDICKSEDKNTLSTNQCEDHPFGGTRDDMCYECMVLGGNGDEEENLQTFRQVYAGYLG